MRWKHGEILNKTKWVAPTLSESEFLSNSNSWDSCLISISYKPQHTYREIVYGAREQTLTDADTSTPLDADGIKHIQGIIGSLLYYAHAVDNKLLAILSAISSHQAKATENTAMAVNQLLDYVATYPSDGITYCASSMILAAHSDTSFLTETGSCSRAGAHIILSKDKPIPWNNGPVLTISQIL